MKRFLCLTFALVLLILPITFSYAAFTSPFVSRLAATAAAAAGSAGIRIPARVTGVTSGGSNVAGWVSLLIPGSNLAKITVGVAAVGGALAADYLMAKGAAWFAANHITLNDDGTYTQTTIANLPPGRTIDDYTGTDGDQEKEGFFDAQAAAGAACEADRAVAWAAAKPYAGYGVSSKCGWGAYPPLYEVNDYAWSQTVQGVTTRHYYFFPKNPPQAGSTPHTFNNPYSLPLMDSQLATALASGDANAILAAQAALDVAAAALDNPNHPLNMNDAIRAAMQAALAGSLNSNQLANLEAGATPNVGDNVLPDDEPNINALTPAQIADAVRAALEGQGLSAAQIAAAIAAAQQAAAQGLTQAEAQAAVEAALVAAGVNAASIQSAVAAALTAAGLATNAGVETAVKNALNDETGVTPPVDSDPLIPDKLSLTAVLTAFVTAIQQLPIMQTLQGLTINTSGTSVLSLTFLGQTYSYDVGGMQGALNTIGSALLGLTTIFSFLGIFRS